MCAGLHSFPGEGSQTEWELPCVLSIQSQHCTHLPLGRYHPALPPGAAVQDKSGHHGSAADSSLAPGYGTCYSGNGLLSPENTDHIESKWAKGELGPTSCARYKGFFFQFLRFYVMWLKMAIFSHQSFLHMMKHYRFSKDSVLFVFPKAFRRLTWISLCLESWLFFPRIVKLFHNHWQTWGQ